jgi:hypothetical protein
MPDNVRGGSLPGLVSILLETFLYKSTSVTRIAQTYSLLTSRTCTLHVHVHRTLSTSVVDPDPHFGRLDPDEDFSCSLDVLYGDK